MTNNKKDWWAVCFGNTIILLSHCKKYAREYAANGRKLLKRNHPQCTTKYEVKLVELEGKEEK